MRRRACTAACLALSACASLVDSDARVYRGTVSFVRSTASSQALAPPFLSVLDSVDLRIVSASGESIAAMGRRLQRNEVQVSLPFSTSGGSFTFSVEVLSSNRATLFTGSIPATISEDGFQVVVPLTARRPVLVVAADTSRTSGDSSTQFQVYNGGADSLTWTISTADQAFASCTPCIIRPRSGTLGRQKAAIVTLSVPVTFPTRDMEFVFHSTEGDVTPVWSYAIANVAGITITPNPSLVGIGLSTPLTATVQSTGSRAVTWSSRDANIATVGPTGVVTGIASGTATITAASQVNPVVAATALVRVHLPVLTSSVPNFSINAPATPDTVVRDLPGGNTTVTLHAEAKTNVGFITPPYSLVEFWARPNGTSLPWRRIGIETVATILDNGTDRFWGWTTAWNPDATDAPYSNGVTRLDLIASGIASSGVYVSLTNTQLWIRIP